jgi:hypothetical protein
MDARKCHEGANLSESQGERELVFVRQASGGRFFRGAGSENAKSGVARRQLRFFWIWVSFSTKEVRMSDKKNDSFSWPSCLRFLKRVLGLVLMILEIIQKLSELF